jgi:hypothetical protein
MGYNEPSFRITPHTGGIGTAMLDRSSHGNCRVLKSFWGSGGGLPEAS